jgi:hypothetical protein
MALHTAAGSPANSHQLSDFQILNLAANSHHSTDGFVAAHNRAWQLSEAAGQHRQIGMTDATIFNPDIDVGDTRLVQRVFNGL